MGVTRILNHISFARDWLNRAEEKVKLGRMVEGEVYLSLAEAEIRKAWEASCFSRERGKYKISAVVTIALIFLFMILGSFYLDSNLSNEEAFRLSLAEHQEINVNQDLRLLNVSLSISNK